MNESIWDEYLSKEEPKILNKDLTVDVLVVGGGICGVLNAYYLTLAGFDVVLLEKNRLGTGVTKNTTAFISAQQELLYIDRMKIVSKPVACRYLKASLEAIDEYKKLSKKFDFDFEECDSNIYSMNEKDRLIEEYEFLYSIGYDPLFKEHRYGLLKYQNQGQMNPIKLINELKKYINYYEETEVLNINSNCAYTENNKIKARNIIMCTHFPSFKIKGLFSLKMYQRKSYVVSFKSDINIKDTYVNLKTRGMYFRKYKDQLIVGGNDIRTGCVKEQFDNIIEYIKKIDPNAKVLKTWTNQDCITLDNLPYIGKIDKHLFVCTGFNLWGMTSSMISALLIRDILLGIDNEYIELFSPKRKMYKKQLFKNILSSIKGLSRVGMRRCNHFGCKLNYIALDDTFECPCHGSKYYKNGEVLNSPAKKKHKPF